MWPQEGPNPLSGHMEPQVLCPQGWYLCCSAELVKPWAWLCPIRVARIQALAMPGSRRGRGDQVLSPYACLECSSPWSQVCCSALWEGAGFHW